MPSREKIRRGRGARGAPGEGNSEGLSVQGVGGVFENSQVAVNCGDGPLAQWKENTAFSPTLPRLIIKFWPSPRRMPHWSACFPSSLYLCKEHSHMKPALAEALIHTITLVHLRHMTWRTFSNHPCFVLAIIGNGSVPCFIGAS